MPETFTWYVPEKVAYLAMPAVTDYEYLSRANSELLAYIAQNPSDSMIHIITDALHARQFPTNLMKIRKISPVFDHERIGWAILVSENAFLRFLGATVPQMLTGKRSRAFTTLEEGIDFLRHRAIDVDWSQADDNSLART